MMVGTSTVGQWYVCCQLLQTISTIDGFSLLETLLKTGGITNTISKHNPLPLYYLSTTQKQLLDNTLLYPDALLSGDNLRDGIDDYYFSNEFSSSDMSAKRSLFYSPPPSAWERILTFQPSSKRHKRKHHVVEHKKKRSDASGFLSNAEKCSYVCGYCSGHVGLRYAGLCFRQCGKGGYAFDTCMTVFSIRHLIADAA